MGIFVRTYERVIPIGVVAGITCYTKGLAREMSERPGYKAIVAFGRKLWRRGNEIERN